MKKHVLRLQSQKSKQRFSVIPEYSVRLAHRIQWYTKNSKLYITIIQVIFLQLQMNHKSWCLKGDFIWLWHKKAKSSYKKQWPFQTILENYQTIQIIVTPSQPVWLFFYTEDCILSSRCATRVETFCFWHQQRDNGRRKNKSDLFILNHL